MESVFQSYLGVLRASACLKNISIARNSAVKTLTFEFTSIFTLLPV
jgi:hypothetical protein